MADIIIQFEKDAVVADLTGKLVELESQFQNTIVEGAKEIIIEELDKETPIRTGNLMMSNFTIDTNQFSFITENSQEYYPFVVLGTAPHIIEGNPWLYWEGADHPVRRVNHPGTAANNYPSRAADPAEAGIISKCEEFISWLVN